MPHKPSAAEFKDINPVFIFRSPTRDDHPKPTHGIPDRENGWLDSEGRFIPLAATYQHCEWCLQYGNPNCQKSISTMGCFREQEGWIKLTKNNWVIVRPTKMTRAQSEFIVTWHLRNHRDLSEFMRLMEDLWE